MTDPGSSKQCTTGGQQVMGICWNMRGSDELQGKAFTPCGQTSKIDKSLSCGGFQDPKVLGNLSDLRAEPALSRGLDKKHPEVPSNLHDPNIYYCNSESRIIKIWHFFFVFENIFSLKIFYKISINLSNLFNPKWKVSVLEFNLNIIEANFKLQFQMGKK